MVEPRLAVADDRARLDARSDGRARGRCAHAVPEVVSRRGPAHEDVNDIAAVPQDHAVVTNLLDATVADDIPDRVPGEVARLRIFEVRARVTGRHHDDPAQDWERGLRPRVPGQRQDEQQTGDDECPPSHDARSLGLHPGSGQAEDTASSSAGETFTLTSNCGVSDLPVGAAMGPGRSSAETMMSRASVLLQFWMTPKMIILGLVVAGLVGALTFATSREMSRNAIPVTVTPPARPTRPALSPVEEAFIQALWPIHGEVQRSLMRTSLGQILYKTNDLSRAELKTRMEQAQEVYGRAETSIRALEPPTSLRNDREIYLDAVRLLRESAVEAMKMFKDGREDHLLIAYPKSQAASDKIREVGGKLWPNEFPPN
jgi:hypothetical protein